MLAGLSKWWLAPSTSACCVLFVYFTEIDQQTKAEKKEFTLCSLKKCMKYFPLVLWKALLHMCSKAPGMTEPHLLQQPWMVIHRPWTVTTVRTAHHSTHSGITTWSPMFKWQGPPHVVFLLHYVCVCTGVRVEIWVANTVNWVLPMLSLADLHTLMWTLTSTWVEILPVSALLTKYVTADWSLPWWNFCPCPFTPSLLQFLVALSGSTYLLDHCLHVQPSEGSMLHLTTLVFAFLWESMTGIELLLTLWGPVYQPTHDAHLLSQCDCSAQVDNDHQCGPWWCAGAGTGGGASNEQWGPMCGRHNESAGGNTWVGEGRGWV